MMNQIKASFFKVVNSFSGHSNQPFEHKDFDTITEMVDYAKSFKRNIYIRFENWSNGPTSIYQEMFV